MKPKERNKVGNDKMTKCTCKESIVTEAQVRVGKLLQDVRE